MAFSEKLSFYVICEMNLVKFLNGYGVKKQAFKVVCTFKGQATLVNDYSDEVQTSYSNSMITNKKF